jgi:hypothetical protein
MFRPIQSIINNLLYFFSWWKAAQLLRHVKSQEEMSLANKLLNETLKHSFTQNTRTFLFNIRFNFFKYYWRWFFGFPFDFNPFEPGLEVKYALEEAEKLNSRIVFLGQEFDAISQQRLYQENRNTILKTLYNSLFKLKPEYSDELNECIYQVHQYGLDKFIESSCDQYFINWYNLF